MANEEKWWAARFESEDRRRTEALPLGIPHEGSATQKFTPSASFSSEAFSSTVRRDLTSTVSTPKTFRRELTSFAPETLRRETTAGVVKRKTLSGEVVHRPFSTLDLARLPNGAGEDGAVIATQALLRLHLSLQSVQSKRKAGAGNPDLAAATDAAFLAANAALRQSTLLHPTAPADIP
eukprot:EG_transcript_32774